MWVFGYGSLMWDGWQTKHACIRSMPAELDGYSRTFTKASVRNWGSKNHPGPTLNLQKMEHQSCRGIAFEFPDHQRQALTRVLTEREGCAPLDLTIRLDNGTEVVALVTVYTGKTGFLSAVDYPGRYPCGERVAASRPKCLILLCGGVAQMVRAAES